MKDNLIWIRSLRMEKNKVPFLAAKKRLDSIFNRAKGIKISGFGRGDLSSCSCSVIINRVYYGGSTSNVPSEKCADEGAPVPRQLAPSTTSCVHTPTL